jgi:hypothetical protein
VFVFVLYFCVSSWWSRATSDTIAKNFRENSGSFGRLQIPSSLTVLMPLRLFGERIHFSFIGLIGSLEGIL